MPYSWSLAIFSARESADTLVRTIEACRAASDERTPIDVIINGNKLLADVACARSSHVAGNLSMWFLETLDKAHAWNEYLQRIWKPSEIAFFIDGYVQVMPDALRLLAATLADDNKALSVSAVPTYGHSATSLQKHMTGEGGLHGNLFALRGDVLSLLRDRQFKLPLGIYRTDGLLGAIMAFNLDPRTNTWDARRTAVQGAATWRVHSRSLFSRVSDGYRRTLRQAQGTLETVAMRQHLAVERKSPEELPRTAADLVGGWLKSHPSEARSIFLKNPLCYVAARRLLAPRDWTSTESGPKLLRAEPPRPLA